MFSHICTTKDERSRFKGKRQWTLAEQANDVSYNYYTSAGKIMVMYKHAGKL